MTQTVLPLRVDGKAIKLPKSRPARKKARPVWSAYKPKHRADCNFCEQVAYESAMAGESFDGIRQARRQRHHEGERLILCEEHAREQRQQDDIDYPSDTQAARYA